METAGLIALDPSYDPLDLPRVWKPAFPELREHQITIDSDVENPTTTLDQAGLEIELPFQLGRQPGGPRQVVSLGAVFDADVHLSPPELLSLTG